MIDLWNSRRDMFNLCEYWSQDEREIDSNSKSRLIYNSVPTGTFMAKEVNSYSMEPQVIGEVFMVEQNTITIQTNDDVSLLKKNDFVKFDNNIYRVENIQKEIIKKQRQYSAKGYSCSYFISLRR